MTMQRCREGARRHRVLEEREALPGLGSLDQEADTDAAEEHLLATPWANHPMLFRSSLLHDLSYRRVLPTGTVKGAGCVRPPSGHHLQGSFPNTAQARVCRTQGNGVPVS